MPITALIEPKPQRLLGDWWNASKHRASLDLLLRYEALYPEFHHASYLFWNMYWKGLECQHGLPARYFILQLKRGMQPSSIVTLRAPVAPHA